MPQNNIVLDDSFDYEKDANEIKSMLTVKKKKDYEGIYCEYSWYLFSKQNKIRLLFYRTVSSMNFEWAILVIIVLSSVMLALDTYTTGLSPNDPRMLVSNYLNIIFTVLFACESLIKSISYGWIQDKGSYLRDSWS